ncbi:NAD-binding protein [Desulfovibrio aminophilus]|uniref:potassium channel family protein n=1 Tax=Desulfovibrio aminophilus TaxID=81425 RepID=UPI003394BD40
MSGLTLKARLYRFQRRYGHFWQILVAFTALSVVFVAGMIGYMTLEGWTLLESFYMMVITLATVGFQEVRPLSDQGRFMTAMIILAGVGGFAYLVGAFSQVLMEGHLHNFWGRLKVQKRIDKMSGHFIVCGFGRIGSVVVREIRAEGQPVVVIEHSPEALEKMRQEDILFVEGDATNDEALLQAGLMRAKSLITALTDEAANVYVTLTARQLNPEVSIIARAAEPNHVARLQMAGADRVVMPNLIGGVRMAQSVLRPTVTNFLDLALRGNIDLQMEELAVLPTSQVAGKDLMESQIRPRFNLIVIAIQKISGEMVFNPGPREIIEAGDTLLAVGRKTDLMKFQEVL